jgi:hypothetical protein
MRVKGARQTRIKRMVRGMLKEAGVERPGAVLHARRQVAGMFKRGSIFDAMLDANRDTSCYANGERRSVGVTDALDTYGAPGLFHLLRERRGQ